MYLKSFPWLCVKQFVDSELEAYWLGPVVQEARDGRTNVRLRYGIRVQWIGKGAHL